MLISTFSAGERPAHSKLSLKWIHMRQRHGPRVHCTCRLHRHPRPNGHHCPSLERHGRNTRKKISLTRGKLDILSNDLLMTCESCDRIMASWLTPRKRNKRTGLHPSSSACSSVWLSGHHRTERSLGMIGKASDPPLGNRLCAFPSAECSERTQLHTLGNRLETQE